MTTQEILILYIVGYLASYILFSRYCRYQEFRKDWMEVFFKIFISLGSWATFFIIMIFFVVEKLGDMGSKYKWKKPPKWL